MTFIKILALIGALFVGIPLLCGICYVLWEFAKYVRKMTWDERLGIMFEIGCGILIMAAMGWILIRTYDRKITAAPSTDTTEQIPPQVENLDQEELPK